MDRRGRAGSLATARHRRRTAAACPLLPVLRRGLAVLPRRPARRCVEARSTLSGVVGLVATVLFAVGYRRHFASSRRFAWADSDDRRARRPACRTGRSGMPSWPLLALIIPLALGQHGTADAGSTSPSPASWTLPDLGRRRSSAGALARGIRADGLPGLRLGPGQRRQPARSSLAVLAVVAACWPAADRNNLSAARARDRAGSWSTERARPDGPRPARHPRPLADRDHGQGRARRAADRGRPGPGAGRDRRPGTLAREALADVRRDGRGVPRGHARRRAGRARAALHAAGHRAPSCRAPSTRCPAERRELFALGRPGGGDERGPAQRRLTLHDQGRPRPGRGSSTTASGSRRRVDRAGSGPQRPARAARARAAAAGRSRPIRRLGFEVHVSVRVAAVVRLALRPALTGSVATARSACCSPTTRRWSAGRWPRCSTWSPTSRWWPRSAAATRWSSASRGARPDVALLDVEMPGMDGIAATAALRAALPGCQVLVVTTFGRPGYLRKAHGGRGRGFVVKDTPARQLADAVRRVHAGLRVVDPALAAESLAAGRVPLTARETEVLRAARATAARSPTSPACCTCPRAPCATTCPRRSARPGPAPGPRRSGSPRSSGWL